MKKKAITCEEFVDSLQAFRDDELAPPERIRAQDHLLRCEKCSTYWRGYERAIELAKHAGSENSVSVALPENLVHRIMRARRQS
ncbi:MAG: zf-HC2 domain-containing protein [Verrucomicrobia bacterium]|nr:zf-HC2 domain-containing protein [Verrucomicrobiota bacterium]